MNFKELLNLVHKEKKKNERVKVAKKFAAVVGILTTVGVATKLLFATKAGKKVQENLKKKAVETVEIIKDSVQKKAETVKESAVLAAKEVSNAIKDVHGKTESVKKEVKEGTKEIAKDIHKTEENISNDVNIQAKRVINYSNTILNLYQRKDDEACYGQSR